MVRLFVDADACPVKNEAIRVAERHGLNVLIVSNGGIRPSRSPLVETVIVPEGPDAADQGIAERIAPGDICITQDVPLAAVCLKAGAMALRSNGEAFTPANIGNTLAHQDDKEQPGLRQALHGMPQVFGWKTACLNPVLSRPVPARQGQRG